MILENVTPKMVKKKIIPFWCKQLNMAAYVYAHMCVHALKFVCSFCRWCWYLETEVGWRCADTDFIPSRKNGCIRRSLPSLPNPYKILHEEQLISVVILSAVKIACYTNFHICLMNLVVLFIDIKVTVSQYPQQKIQV